MISMKKLCRISKGNPIMIHYNKEESLLGLNLQKNNHCFVCGSENKDGLKLKMEREGERGVRTEFIALDHYRGWSEFLHGGIIGLIFDELLGWLSLYLGYDAMTARLQIRYRNPVPLGSRITFTGSVEKEHKKILDIKTTAFLDDGAIVAEGKGRMMIINRRA